MTSHGRDPGAVFVDRDGVICENRSDYVRSWSEFVFLPGAIEALASLRRAGHRLIVVTNQSVVGRGLLSRRDLDLIHERMLDSLGGSGAKVDAIMVCPHHPDDACTCRKPQPGLLRDASDRLKLDLTSAFLIGDHATDIEAGARAGTTTILVRTGRGVDIADDAHSWEYRPDFIADDLIDAALWVLARQASGPPAGRLAGPDVAARRAEVNRR